jgi:hypothetical protein
MKQFKISNKDKNKLVSFVDRHFTYDSRKLKRENADTAFDFFGINYDTNTIIVVDCSKTTVYTAIKQKNKYIHKGFICSFNELSQFKKMIRCLG